MIAIIDDKEHTADYCGFKLAQQLPELFKDDVIVAESFQELYALVGRSKITPSTEELATYFKDKFKYIFFHQSQDKKLGDKIHFDDDEILCFKEIIGYDRFIGFSGGKGNIETNIEMILSGDDVGYRLYRQFFYSNFYFFLHWFKISGEYDLSLLNKKSPQTKIAGALRDEIEESIESSNEDFLQEQVRKLCRLWTEEHYIKRIEEINSDDPFEMRERVETVISIIISNYQYQYIKEI